MVTPDERAEKVFRCPALTTIKVVSGKWKTRILWLLRERPYGFNELRRALPGVAAKVLSDQIAQLEEARIVQKTMVPRDGQVFADVSYSSYGLSLIPILDALGNWGLEHQERMASHDAS